MTFWSFLWSDSALLDDLGLIPIKKQFRGGEDIYSSNFPLSCALVLLTQGCADLGAYGGKWGGGAIKAQFGLGCNPAQHTLQL